MKEPWERCTDSVECVECWVCRALEGRRLKEGWQALAGWRVQHWKACVCWVRESIESHRWIWRMKKSQRISGWSFERRTKASESSIPLYQIFRYILQLSSPNFSSYKILRNPCKIIFTHTGSYICHSVMISPADLFRYFKYLFILFIVNTLFPPFLPSSFVLFFKLLTSCRWTQLTIMA